MRAIKSTRVEVCIHPSSKVHINLKSYITIGTTDRSVKIHTHMHVINVVSIPLKTMPVHLFSAEVLRHFHTHK